MSNLWNYIKGVFSSKFEKKSVPQSEVTQSVTNTTESALYSDNVEESKPEVTEIKVEYIKEDPPKRKKRTKKEKVVENISTTATNKRGPKKSKKS